MFYINESYMSTAFKNMLRNTKSGIVNSKKNLFNLVGIINVSWP